MKKTLDIPVKLSLHDIELTHVSRRDTRSMLRYHGTMLVPKGNGLRQPINISSMTLENLKAKYVHY